MNQFILHSALDIVEEVQWVQKELYLKTVDRFNNLLVSCFLTAGSMLSSLSASPLTAWGTRFNLSRYQIPPAARF
jgi:hypothetical protein